MSEHSKINLSFEEMILLGFRDRFNKEGSECKIDRNIFDNEIVFESILLGQNQIPPSIDQDDSDARWAEMVTTTVNRNGAELLFTDEQWRLMIDTAIINGSKKHVNTISAFFRVTYKYGIAALLVLFLAGPLFFFKMAKKQPINKVFSNLNVSGSEGNSTTRNNAGSGDNTLPENAEKKIVKLDSGTIVLTESKTELSNIVITDTNVSLKIKNGTALFSVARKQSRTFTVQSIFADVFVTGTVFRVTDKENYSMVQVQSGSVKVFHTIKRDSTVLRDKQIAVVDNDTIIVFIPDSAQSIPERKLLDNFIRNNRFDSRSTDNRVGSQHESTPEHLESDERDSLSDESGLDIDIRNEDDALFTISKVLELRKDFSVALRILELVSKNQGNDLKKVMFRKYMLNLERGDTNRAVDLLDEYKKNVQSDTDRCTVNGKLYTIYLKKNMLRQADQCLDEMKLCGFSGSLSMELLIFEHANLLRNAGHLQRALYWYVLIIESYPESVFRTDAEYWVSFCIVQDGIVKRSARKFPDTSGW